MFERALAPHTPKLEDVPVWTPADVPVAVDFGRLVSVSHHVRGVRWVAAHYGEGRVHEPYFTRYRYSHRNDGLTSSLTEDMLGHVLADHIVRPQGRTLPTTLHRIPFDMPPEDSLPGCVVGSVVRYSGRTFPGTGGGSPSMFGYYESDPEPPTWAAHKGQHLIVVALEPAACGPTAPWLVECLPEDVAARDGVH